MNDEMSKIQQEHGPVNSWLVMWEKGMTPWNTPEAALGLKLLLDQNRIPTTGKFIIPGCGQGLDCFALLNGSRTIYGVDLSPKIIQENIQKQISLGISESELIFKSGDFFEMGKDLGEGTFDFLMDYTFLCAIQPDMRLSWAKQLQNLLKSGAMLLTLMYPLSDHAGGPPFALSEQVYHDLLDPYFELISIEIGPTIERRQGKEKLAIWKRK
jgi:hypothetical protein